METWLKPGLSAQEASGNGSSGHQAAGSHGGSEPESTARVGVANVPLMGEHQHPGRGARARSWHGKHGGRARHVVGN